MTGGGFTMTFARPASGAQAGRYQFPCAIARAATTPDLIEQLVCVGTWLIMGFLPPHPRSGLAREFYDGKSHPARATTTRCGPGQLLAGILLALGRAA